MLECKVEDMGLLLEFFCPYRPTVNECGHASRPVRTRRTGALEPTAIELSSSPSNVAVLPLGFQNFQPILAADPKSDLFRFCGGRLS